MFREPATSPAHAIRPDDRQTSVRCGFLKVLTCGLEESPEVLGVARWSPDLRRHFSGRRPVALTN